MICTGCGASSDRLLRDYGYIAGDRFRAAVPGLRIFRCTACGLLQVDHDSVDDAALLSYYGGAYRGDGHSATSRTSFARKVGRGRGLAALTNRHLGGDQPKIVFEFGAGHLGNIQAAREAWPDAALYCDDADQGAIGSAAALGAAIRRVDAFSGDIDVLLLCHVLEHFRAPADVLAGLAERIRPGGLLVIEVPNDSESRVANALAHDPHITFFDRTSLLAMFAAKLAGIYDVLETATCGPPKEAGSTRRIMDPIRQLKRKIAKHTGLELVNPMIAQDAWQENRVDDAGRGLRLVARRR